LLTESAAAVTMQFPVTRDAGIFSHDGAQEQATNGGASPTVRTNRYNQNTTIIDFDTNAMAAFLAANPGPATWTLHVNVLDKNHNGDVSVQTVESTNDWAEGDGNTAVSASRFNWTPGTAAATYLYAQTYYKESATTPGVMVVDRDLSKPWFDPDTANGIYVFTKRNPDPGTYGAPGSIQGSPTPQFTNSAKFLLADLNGTDADASVVIDPAIINAMITDPNNRGLRFGIFGVQGTGVENDSNARIHTRETVGKGAYLEVTVVPEPTSLMLLIGSVCCLPFRRR
jgi:hypothetical protein